MENINNCGIYKIINNVNNKYYIGSSNNFKLRIRKHFELLSRNKHHSIYLQNAFNKYGKENFCHEIIELCDKKDTLIIEQKYLNNINDWKLVYNMSKIASGHLLDLSTHPNQIEIRKKYSLANKGKHTKPFIINNNNYKTLLDAANEFNVDIKTISYKLKNWKYKDYYYINFQKIGDYNENIHKLYWYKPKIENKKYYCNCGIEIKNTRTFCNKCIKIRRDNKEYIRLVTINNIEYQSIKSASKMLNIDYPTLLYRVKSKTITFKDFYYNDTPKDESKLVTIDDINKKISKKNIGNLHNNKPFKINDNIFKSLTKASNDLNIPKTTIVNRLKNIKNINYKYLN